MESPQLFDAPTYTDFSQGTFPYSKVEVEKWFAIKRRTAVSRPLKPAYLQPTVSSVSKSVLSRSLSVPNLPSAVKRKQRVPLLPSKRLKP
jgi:hypothetical protein